MTDQDKLRQAMREALQEALLREDDDGGGYDNGTGDAYHGWSGGGGGAYHVSTNSVADIFLDPLKDIAKTALWGVGTLTSKTKNLILSLVMGAISGMLPFGDTVTTSFEKFQSKEWKELGFLDKTYGQALSNNITALQSSDVAGIAFMLDPQWFLAAKLLFRAPQVALGFLDLFTEGEASRLLKTQTRGQQKTSSVHHGSSHSSHTSAYVDPNAGDDWGSLYENGEAFGQQLAALMKNPAIIQRLAQSPVKAAMRRDALTALTRRYYSVRNAKDIRSLEGIGNINLSGKLGKLGSVEPNQEKEGLGGVILNSIKQSYPDAFSKSLRNMGKRYPRLSPTFETLLSQLSSK